MCADFKAIPRIPLVMVTEWVFPPFFFPLFVLLFFYLRHLVDCILSVCMLLPAAWQLHSICQRSRQEESVRHTRWKARWKMWAFSCEKLAEKSGNVVLEAVESEQRDEKLRRTVKIIVCHGAAAKVTRLNIKIFDHFIILLHVLITAVTLV